MVFPQATTSLTAFDLSAINSDIPCIVNSRSPIRDMLTEAGVVAAAMDSAEDMADALIEAAASPVPEKRNIRPSGNEGLARFLATQCVEGRKPASRPDTAVAVSAVVTCFNLGPYIGEALRSLWSTLDRNRDEIIVVDDGSTDQATIQVLDELSEQGECKLIRTRNRGVSLARNTGIAAAKNEFVLICDGDDGVKPEFARRALQVLLTHPKAGAVYAWRLHVPNMNGLVRIQWDFEVPWGLCSNPGGSLILLRKNAFATTPGYSHEMRYNYEDWEILVSLREKGWECLAIPQCLAISRMRNDSKLQSLSAWRRTHVLERMISLHEKLFSDAAPSLIRLAQANTDYFWYASQPASSVTPSTVKSAHAAIQAMERALAHAESLGLRRVAIYGCGAHSRKAAEAFASAPVEIAGFIDDKPSMLKFLGWPVHSLDDVGSLGVDAIILSSDTIEDKLFENIRACPAGAGIAVVRPYVDTKGLRSQNGNGNLNRDAAIRMGQGLRKAEESGRKRIAVYGIGRHTQKAVQALAEARGRIVGFVDEGDRAASTFMGWPVRGLGEIQSLNPDALSMSVGPAEEKGASELPSMGQAVTA
jgi:glycosyltransferase involved in cell wall biosynthesis